MVKKNFLIKNILQNFSTHIKTRMSARKSKRLNRAKKEILNNKKSSKRKKEKKTKMPDIFEEKFTENAMGKVMDNAIELIKKNMLLCHVPQISNFNLPEIKNLSSKRNRLNFSDDPKEVINHFNILEPGPQIC